MKIHDRRGEERKPGFTGSTGSTFTIFISFKKGMYKFGDRCAWEKGEAVEERRWEKGWKR